MPRLLIINDPHFSLHAPECRGEEYGTEILDKFHEVARIALKLKVETVGCTGDWYHRKGKVTFKESNNLLAVLTSFARKGLKTIGILGNHDIAGHSLDSLDGRAVGAMVHSKALQLLDHQPYWIQDGTGSLYVTGTSYFHGCDRDDEARVRMYGATVPWDREGPEEKPIHVHFAHGTLVQKGEFFEEFTVAGPLVELLSERGVCPDVIVCGHLHYSEGIKFHPRPNGERTAVCRIGSLGRVSKDDLERIPAALLIATLGSRLILKEIPIGKEASRSQPRGKDDQGQEGRDRVRGFVGALREQADAWSSGDHRSLILKTAELMEFSPQVAQIALRAVEQRQ